MEEPTEIKKKIVGTCNQCAKCCKDIQLDYNPYSSNGARDLLDVDYNALIRKCIGIHLKSNPHLDLRNLWRISFRWEDGNARIYLEGAECMALEKKGDTYFCKIHDKAPPICKKYPSSDSWLPKECSYRKIKIKEKPKKKIKAKKKRGKKK